MEIVEGKNHPKELPDDPTNATGKTNGILLCPKKLIHSLGKLSVLDSGICILQGIIDLRKVGVFSAAVIKKRRYWPRHVPDQKIDHFRRTK